MSCVCWLCRRPEPGCGGLQQRTGQGAPPPEPWEDPQPRPPPGAFSARGCLRSCGCVWFGGAPSPFAAVVVSHLYTNKLTEWGLCVGKSDYIVFYSTRLRTKILIFPYGELSQCREMRGGLLAGIRSRCERPVSSGRLSCCPACGLDTSLSILHLVRGLRRMMGTNMTARLSSSRAGPTVLSASWSSRRRPHRATSSRSNILSRRQGQRPQRRLRRRQGSAPGAGCRRRRRHSAVRVKVSDSRSSSDRGGTWIAWTPARSPRKLVLFLLHRAFPTTVVVELPPRRPKGSPTAAASELLLGNQETVSHQRRVRRRGPSTKKSRRGLEPGRRAGGATGAGAAGTGRTPERRRPRSSRLQ